MEKHKYLTIEEYIGQFPLSVQERLKTICSLVLQNTSDAQECISYNMPAFKLNAMLIYFAAYQNHVGLYPSGSAIKVFKSQLENYKTGKGSIQFRHDVPFPVDLIQKIIQFRIEENKNKVILNPKKRLK